MSKYEAVIGTDIEDAMWGTSLVSATAAIERAVEQYASECNPFTGDTYTVTVYRDPIDRENLDGDPEIVGWADRGRCEAVYHTESMRLAWSVSDIVWDGVAVTP